jgi:hypothetical protein
MNKKKSIKLWNFISYLCRLSVYLFYPIIEMSKKNEILRLTFNGFMVERRINFNFSSYFLSYKPESRAQPLTEIVVLLSSIDEEEVNEIFHAHRSFSYPYQNIQLF